MQSLQLLNSHVPLFVPSAGSKLHAARSVQPGTCAAAPATVDRTSTRAAKQEKTPEAKGACIAADLVE